MSAERDKGAGRRWPADEDPQFPLLESHQYLLDYLFKLGVVVNHGFGASGISWADLLAWAHLTEANLNPWEFEALYEMSAAYAATLEQAKSPACPAPWTPTIEEQRKAVSNQLANLLNAMSSKRSDG